MLVNIIASALVGLLPLTAARDVFAHYMVQGLDGSTTHAADDIQDALAIGLDGFALNVGSTDRWATDAIQQLFSAASGTDFKLFFSLDTNQFNDVNGFTGLINTYIENPNYYAWDGKPFLSTFNSGGHDPAYWSAFLGTLSKEPYFVPDFDNTSNYYSDINAWLQTWSDVVDGVFSWETAWPAAEGGATNVTTDADEAIISAVSQAGKSYMIGLSSLQYKHYGSDHWYRVGEVALPQRMEEILALPTRPDFVEILTWNDAGESHYIGTLHYEGLTGDTTQYANNEDFTHTGWQSLLASFIVAFKNDVDAAQMVPANGADLIGSMWYRTILTSASCSSDNLGKPTGAPKAKDAVNWAILAKEGVSGWAVQVWSNGQLVLHEPVSTGLNYFSTPGMATGIQYVEVIDTNADNKILYSAQGTVDVEAEATGICNYNYQVAELVART